VSKVRRKSPHLELIAIAEDQTTGEFIAIIEFDDIDGEVRRLEQPRSSLRKIEQLKDALDNAGASLSMNDRENEKAIRRLYASAAGAERWKYAPSVGWYDGHRAFVLPYSTIGMPRGTARILPPRRFANNPALELRSKGRHKEWLSSVAEPARHSSSMVLGICMALAAPLLDFRDFHSFGILLSGPSKSAKSTALVVAGSVIGIPEENKLPNFRTTDAALGELPTAFNDMIMPINELGLLKGTRKDRHDRVRDLAYGFAEGRGTTYSKFVGQHNGNRDHKWRTLALGTGEETLERIAQNSGDSRSMGETIRWIDLCGAKSGAKDIFDRQMNISADDRITWVRRQCQSLRAAVTKNHGVAFEHYIKRIIKNRLKISEWISPLIDEFIRNTAEEGDHAAILHLASCFGLIRAAGILGVRFGTLPYSEKFVDRCIMRNYRAARRTLRTDTELLRSALRRLRTKLNSPGVIRSVAKKGRRADTFKIADGYMDRTGSRTKVTIRAEKFKGWFDDARQPALLLRWLQSKKALLCKPTLPTKSGNAIVWAESQPEWPNGSRPRSIVIELGDGLLDRIRV
jgi:hypothetical protein